jgi:tetratricopeptide (TPR) repeat protein
MAGAAAAPLAVPGDAAPDDAAFANRTHQAEQLIAANRTAEARAVLEQLERSRPHAAQVQFLLGLLDRQDKDYDSAIHRFRRILVDDPKAVRVRLELARTFYEADDYAGAERQFRFARAGKLPEAVAQNVDRYLMAVRQRKTFSFGLAVAIVPDSNLNAGPATDTVTLYGLPFELSPDARKNSGVGASIDLSTEWAPRVAGNTKLRVGGQLHRVQYGASQFNDMTLSAYAGPRVNLKRWELNIVGSAARRWYGDKPYTDLFAGSFDATYNVTARFAVGGAASVNYIDYLRNPLQSGPGGTLAANVIYVPTPASLLRGTVQAGRQGAKIKGYANRSRLVGLQYLREFKGGITVALSPAYTRIDYDGPLSPERPNDTFGITRRDRQFTVQAALLNRRIDWYGFTPRLAYTYTRNVSSIALYTFSRSRFEIGLTSEF